MDNLERFNPENFTDEVVKEINSMSYEEISELADIPGYFLIRDKSTNKPFTGQSTFRNFAVLHRLGHGKRFEVVGVHENTLNNAAIITEEIPVQDEFITPQQAIIVTENPDPKKDSAEEEEIPEPEVTAHDDNIQNEITSTPEITLQDYTTEQVKESEIFPTEVALQEEIVVDSQNEEPAQNAVPGTENLKPETENTAAEVKATKSQSTEPKSKKSK